ncbi:ABC transporter substrate-binding protein [Lederbergia lenta]|uniref:Sugar ABC transporter substrate-binding protein n=1 Tax=Lederbergia lenta TaxID=1467 RepID=A0A2X4W4B4_LEDLE|nr:ABC transporter substrate-binding protein [Lederbergia lenta]SQI53782.1 sugar ABC transporter substrate-binding protein [Lederbergia lenta]
MKKTAIIFISILAMMMMLVACSSNETKGNETEKKGNKEEVAINPVGELPIVDETMTLRMFAPQYASIENMETNLYTKWLEEKTNIHIDWDLVPNDALNDRKQLMLASGDYPEVILHGALTPEEQMRYGKQGVFLPLNDLIEKYAPNVKQAMESLEYLSQSITAPDGNIYSIPMVNECYHCTYPNKYWINEKWIKNVGLDIPTTTDELYTVLKAFKEKDPNGNGKADEVPLTGATEETMWGGNFAAYLMNPFIYNDADTYLRVQDNAVSLAANTDEWKEGLKYMNKLYSEGLIDMGAFTQNADAVNQLANRDSDNVMGSITTALISYAFSTDDQTPRHKEYVTVPPLKGPNGVQQANVQESVTSGQFALTNKATEEQQIAAIRLVDFLFTEEAVLLQEYGPEGQGWRKAEEGELDYDGNQAKYTQLPVEAAQTHNNGWEQIGPSLRTFEYRASFTAPEDPLAEGGYGTRLHQETKKNYEPYGTTEAYPSSIFIDLEDSSEAAQLKTTIGDYIESNLAQFVTGTQDIDKDWDKYIKGFKGLQLERYLEIYQQAYDR